MRKWCPEPFDDTSGVVAPAAGAPRDAATVFTAAREEAAEWETDRRRLFMSESGFQGPETMMAHLTSEERSQLYDLVEQDLSAAYQEREREMAQAQASELEKARQDFAHALDTWSERISASRARHCQEVAAAAARITLVLAEKIIRGKVETDPEILRRGLETALFKLEERQDITVVAHPDEAEWLESQPEVLRKQGITQVQADRRVDKGGCLIRTETREWDATLKGQLAYLGDLVEEMIATQETPDLNREDATDADPLD
ncbi:hypothetical protein CSA17_03295 [bacterium DOLJORAL78_65_58]|nr:MAG: hypothetical protein CSB20_07025 [bacterium DOLZORAL124_64_63]PIE76243.1 MAG: hypothetical protein CSA17_03295 [bacterium DOLJORAL78_65_58]